MLKNGDFIRLEYEAYDQDGNNFDSTRGEIGKTLHGKDGPLLIVVGHYRLVKGLDDAVRSMKKGEEREVAFGPDRAFGSRSKSMAKVMGLADFMQHNVLPKPGITIHLDTGQGRIFGTVKSVSGGRVLVDFNHPLAGKKVRYRVKIVDVVESLEGKLHALLDELGMAGKLAVKDNEALVTLDKKGKDFELKKATFLAMAKSFIPELKKIDAKESRTPQSSRDLVSRPSGSS